MSSELKKAVCSAVCNGGGSSCWLVKSCCYCRSVSISSAGTASSFLSSSLCPTPHPEAQSDPPCSSGDGRDDVTGTKPRIRSDCNQGFYYWVICLCVVGLMRNRGSSEVLTDCKQTRVSFINSRMRRGPGTWN